MIFSFTILYLKYYLINSFYFTLIFSFIFVIFLNKFQLFIFLIFLFYIIDLKFIY